MEHAADPDSATGPRGVCAAESVSPFLRLNFATVWVRNQERSRQFFIEQLGFQPIVDEDVAGQERWIVVAPCSPQWLPGPAAGGLSGIALVVPPSNSPELQRIGRSTGLSFLTEDVRAVFNEWSDRGVRFLHPPFEPPWGSGQARYAVFEDVDGNSFSIIEFDEASRTVEAERRAQAAKQEAERRAAHDLAIAKQVQARLFPQRQPLLQTLRYAGTCIPARAVGGDYYDFLDLGSGRLGLVIADIAGKGMAAALLMANLQANLRSQCATVLDDPLQFLRSVNQAFYENTSDSDYATLFFAEYDDSTRRLRYSNCGHPPPLLLRAGHRVERLEATSTVIGLFEQWDCAMEELQMFPGDTLMLYTDGVTEAVNQAEEEFGEQGLLEALPHCGEKTAEEQLAAITARVQDFSAHEQADDITVIVASCL